MHKTQKKKVYTMLFASTLISMLTVHPQAASHIPSEADAAPSAAAAAVPNWEESIDEATLLREAFEKKYKEDLAAAKTQGEKLAVIKAYIKSKPPLTAEEQAERLAKAQVKAEADWAAKTPAEQAKSITSMKSMFYGLKGSIEDFLAGRLPLDKTPYSYQAFVEAQMTAAALRTSATEAAAKETLAEQEARELAEAINRSIAETTARFEKQKAALSPAGKADAGSEGGGASGSTLALAASGARTDYKDFEDNAADSWMLSCGANPYGYRKTN